MTTSWRSALALLVVSAVALAGCGVPARTDVRVDGPVAEVDSPGAGGEPDPPPSPNEASDERQLVDYFLHAAAADPDDAVEQVRGFIHSKERDDWQPDSQVIVVRVEDSVETPAGDQVRFDLVVRQLGVLADGRIEPRVREPEPVEFFVASERVRADNGFGVEVTRERYRIVDPPRMIMLEDRALDRYFLPRQVYFWDSDHQVLVPDLRWLPTAQAAARRPQLLLEWLLAGPSPWLSSLEGLPEGVDQIGNVVPDTDKLVVELTAPAGDVAAGDLDAQLWWTLRPELADGMTLTLLIDGQARTVEQRDHPRNLAAGAPTESFVVLDGQVWSYSTDEPRQPAALDEPTNTDVHAAAVTHRGRAAALVQKASDGLRLVLADPGRTVETTLSGARTMSRPVWLAEPGGVGLVIADGQLYRFAYREEGVFPVSVPAPLSGPITDVAASPDGRRLALLAGGGLYVALMRRDGSMVSVNPPQTLPTTATQLAGVAFSRANRLAVIGQEEGRFWLYELTVDGGLEERFPFDLGAPPTIRGLVAHPADPVGDSARPGDIMYEADGRAYVYTQRPEPILAEELGQEATEEEPADPRAPFFLE